MNPRISLSTSKLFLRFMFYFVNTGLLHAISFWYTSNIAEMFASITQDKRINHTFLKSVWWILYVYVWCEIYTHYILHSLHTTVNLFLREKRGTEKLSQKNSMQVEVFSSSITTEKSDLYKVYCHLQVNAIQQNIQV